MVNWDWDFNQCRCWGKRGRGLNLKGWDVKISIASISFLEKSSWIILGSLSQSITGQTERLFSLCLSTCCCSTQLTPAPSLFSVILSNSFYYLESIEWACQLKETLSPLTVLWSLIKEGSTCQRCSANWQVEKPCIKEYEVSPVKPNAHSISLKWTISYRYLPHCWHFIPWTEEILSF